MSPTDIAVLGRYMTIFGQRVEPRQSCQSQVSSTLFYSPFPIKGRIIHNVGVTMLKHAKKSKTCCSVSASFQDLSPDGDSLSCKMLRKNFQ